MYRNSITTDLLGWRFGGSFDELSEPSVAHLPARQSM
jgi:hypothetical protein